MHGQVIPFVSLDFNPNRISVSISNEQCANLIAKVLSFARQDKHTLHDFESLTGHLNWPFAVFPLLKLASLLFIKKYQAKCYHLHPSIIQILECK